MVTNIISILKQWPLVGGSDSREVVAREGLTEVFVHIALKALMLDNLANLLQCCKLGLESLSFQYTHSQHSHCNWLQRSGVPILFKSEFFQAVISQLHNVRVNSKTAYPPPLGQSPGI